MDSTKDRANRRILAGGDAESWRVHWLSNKGAPGPPSSPSDGSNGSGRSAGVVEGLL